MGFINHIPNIFPPDIHRPFPRTWKRGLMAWQGLHQGAVKSRTKAQDSCGFWGKTVPGLKSNNQKVGERWDFSIELKFYDMLLWICLKHI